MSLHLLEKQTSEHLRARLMDCVAGQTAESRMNTRPFVVSPDMSLEAAGQYLTSQHVTRVPVVDTARRLLGILSERGLVSALVAPLAAPPQNDAAAPTLSASGLHAMLRLCVRPGEGNHLTAEALADREAPIISASASWDAIVRAVHSTDACLAIVVDGDGLTLGLIDERSLLEHTLPGLSGGSRSALRRILTSTPGQVATALRAQSAANLTADAVMRRDIRRLPTDLPIADALARMLEAQRSDVAVVTAPDGRPLGVLWRDDALHALVTPSAAGIHAGASPARPMNAREARTQRRRNLGRRSAPNPTWYILWNLSVVSWAGPHWRRM